MSEPSKGAIFPQGEPLPEDLAQNFTGTAFLHMLVTGGTAWNCPIGNVTFEAGCRNHWHRHPGGQILLVTSGRGWYQQEGAPAIELCPGSVVTIPQNAKHWHGAAKDSPLTHLSIETNVHMGPAQWLEPVPDDVYNALK